MRVLSRHCLARWTAANGINRDDLTWTDPAPVRLLVKEPVTPEHDSGPHRKVALPGDGEIVKMPLGDRPVLGRFVVDAFASEQASTVFALGTPESYWLNNRGYAEYLWRVADARRLHGALRRCGITDGFRGGFAVGPHEYATHLPMLASQPFCGGPDVLFASKEPELLIRSCRELDLHIEVRDRDLGDRVEHLAKAAGLEVRRSEMPVVADHNDD